MSQQQLTRRFNQSEDIVQDIQNTKTIVEAFIKTKHYQKKGPYADKLDFPGGGIEFGESPEQELRRELSEEVAMEFDSLQLIDNLTATVNVHLASSSHAYTFFHVGMIYQLNGFRSIGKQTAQELQHTWIDPKTLSKDQCSSLLWEYRLIQMGKK